LRPTLVEAVQYRFGAHTTADDPTVYRDSDEVEKWKRKDPIPRLETFLRDTGRLDDEQVDEIETEVQELVADAIETAESTPRPDPAEMFDHVFAEQTPDLEAQYESFAALREEFGDDAFLNE
jgi:pyruvate dehydrogenase E1 component alpha subunit